MKSIHLKLSETLYKEALEVKKEFGFMNIQELIREYIRKAIHEHHKRQALKNLKKNFGSLKGKVKRLTRGDKDKLAQELIKNPKAYEGIFAKYNL